MGSTLPLPLSVGNPRRYISIVVVLVICLHMVISWKGYGGGIFSSGSGVEEKAQAEILEQAEVARVTVQHHTPTSYGSRPLSNNSYPLDDGQANATFVMLCRNSDINGVVSSIQSVEDRFNRKFNYPWVLLNDEPFTEEFKQRVSVLTRAPLEFGLVPSEQWVQPDWIDEERAKAGRLRMVAQRIIYGGSVSYRNMCRFNSGFFFHHQLLKPYRYYWRVEPDVKFFCDIDYDPFAFMQQHDKVYGFTISLLEWEATIPSLWSAVKEFIAINPQYVDPENAMDFVSNDGGATYNRCHFWSNFEIADLDFWRSEQYQAFFDYLEDKGGFYYERWGDAPIHSIATALFARRDQIHFFRDIGYKHEHFQHCPQGDQWSNGRCSCDPGDSFDKHPDSCINKFEALFS